MYLKIHAQTSEYENLNFKILKKWAKLYIKKIVGF